MKTIFFEIHKLVLPRHGVAGLIAIATLFAFSNSSFALWPAGVYRFDAISGTVLEKETREPIEGVVVVGHWGLERSVGYSGTTYTGPLLVKEAVTDKDGKFSIAATVTTDIHRSGHFIADRYPEIAFFKSGFDFTVYKQSGKYPQNGIRPPFDTLHENEYLMLKWLPDRTALVKKLDTTILSFTLTTSASVCADFEGVTPLLLSAMRIERDRIAKTDIELAGYFAGAYRLLDMESCARNINRGKKP